VFAACIAACGALVGLPSPASAGTAAGEVSGLMTISPGISGFSPTVQTYTFGSVILVGAFASDDGSKTYVGAFGVDDLTATTTHGGDLPDESGVVNPFSWDTEEGFPGVGSLNAGTCSGTYSRLFTTFQMTLDCSVGIGAGEANFHATIAVVANLVPVAGDGVLNPIRQAALAGVFHS
jgi:hypothetical protein